MIPYLILTNTITAAICWSIGYRMSRPPSRIWACAGCDTLALTADEQQAFQRIRDHFDKDQAA